MTTLSRTPARRATPLHCKLPAFPAACKTAAARRRTARVLLAPTATTFGHLQLTETKGDKVTRTNFQIDVLSCEVGGVAYRLTKFADDRRGDGDDVYDVRLDGRDSSCECKGHLRWGGECRHISSLAALVTAGKL